MRQLFSFTFLIFYSAAILQLSFLAFSDVLDDGFLTYVSVCFGICTAPAIRLFQKWRHAKSAYYIVESEPGTTPFHNKLINFPLLIMFSTFGFIGAISVSNHVFASEELHTEEFVVKATGQRRVRYDMFEYIFISNGKFETAFNLGREANKTYNKGDKLTVTLKEGLWGYHIVEKVEHGG